MNVNSMEAADVTYFKSLIEEHDKMLKELEKKKSQNKAAYQKWRSKMTEEEFKAKKAIFNKTYQERKKAKQAVV